MDMIRRYFPQAMQVGDLKSLVVTILMYVIVNFVGGVVLGLLDEIPLVGFVFGIVDLLLSVYCAIGIIVALLVFLRIIK